MSIKESLSSILKKDPALASIANISTLAHTWQFTRSMVHKVHWFASSVLCCSTHSVDNSVLWAVGRTTHIDLQFHMEYIGWTLSLTENTSPMHMQNTGQREIRPLKTKRITGKNVIIYSQ